MNRIIEIAAMAIGGLSLFLVAFVGFVSLSGKDMSRVAVIGKLFPAPAEKDGHGEDAKEEQAGEESSGEKGKGLSDAAVVEASLGVLSAWTLPSPYSTTELRGLSEEIKKKHGELEEREHALARRERTVQDDEAELAERMKSLTEMQQHLESLQGELSEREQAVARRESVVEASADSRWASVAGVIAAIEEPAAAAKRLADYQPEEAAKILRAMGDDERAGTILNALEGIRRRLHRREGARGRQGQEEVGASTASAGLQPGFFSYFLLAEQARERSRAGARRSRVTIGPVGHVQSPRRGAGGRSVPERKQGVARARDRRAAP